MANPKLIKLTAAQFQRSCKVRHMSHIWLYNREETTQRTNPNSIFLTKTVGQPFACLTYESDKQLSDADLELLFGPGTFSEGGVSPADKETMQYDCFYIKN